MIHDRYINNILVIFILQYAKHYLLHLPMEFQQVISHGTCYKCIHDFINQLILLIIIMQADMKSIRSQLAGEMRKGSIQKVNLPNKESASCLQLQHLTKKSQCTERKNHSNISLEDFDIGNHNSHSQSITDKSLPTREDNHSLSFPPENPIFSQVIKWDELEPSLQLVLPEDEKYTYVVETYHIKEKLKFQGSPDVAFEAQVRINLNNEIEVKEWLDKMQQHSQVQCAQHAYRGYKNTQT